MDPFDGGGRQHWQLGGRSAGWVCAGVGPGWSGDVAEAVDGLHDRVSGFRFTDVANHLELPRL